MNSLNNTFSNETLNAAVSALGANQEALSLMLEELQTIEAAEIAQRRLMDTLGVTQSEAEEICEDIRKGLDAFDTHMAESAANDKADLRSCLDEVTAGMEPEQRTNFLNAVLSAFQAAGRTSLTKEDVDALTEANAGLTDEELTAAIQEQFDNNISLDRLAAFVETGMGNDDIVKLSNEIKSNSDAYRLLAATLLYEAQAKGDVKFSAEIAPLPATMLGSLSAAAIEMVNTTADLNDGKISLRKWQKVMKFILGAVIACALTYLAVIALGYAVSTIIGLALGIFGTSLIAIVAAVAIGFYLCWDIPKYEFMCISNILSWLSETYDQYIEPVTRKVISWAKAIKNWFASLFTKKEKVGETTAEGKTETIAATAGECEEETSVTDPGIVIA